MRSDGLSLIAAFLVLIGGTFTDLRYQCVEVGQVDLSADEVVDFGGLVVLYGLHIVRVLVAVLRLLFQAAGLGTWFGVAVRVRGSLGCRIFFLFLHSSFIAKVILVTLHLGKVQARDQRIRSSILLASCSFKPVTHDGLR